MAAAGRSIAVVGAGGIGRRQMKALASAGARVIAVTRRPEAAAALRAEGLETAADLAAAAATGATACVIASETGRHAADAEAAFALGLDALIEKPLAVDAPEGRRAAEAARRAGRRAYVACVMRFSPSLALAKARLPELGSLHAARAECRAYLPDWRPDRDHRTSYAADPAQGGVMRDLIHEIDYCGWLFGFSDAPTGSCANLGRLGLASEEVAEIAWRLPGGGALTIGLDYLTRPARRRLTVHGEHGTLEWDARAGTSTLTLAGKAPLVETAAEDADARLRAQAAAFLAALDGRPDERLAGLDDGVRALAICDAVRGGAH
ncbi:MAG: Gfo/Idh/MocA family oxidoreductase [Elusimicrobia bacterium]|nr:Gfo/Idh/MocA family oxidoreductase [Elusimicrobiota bacterium]